MLIESIENEKVKLWRKLRQTKYINQYNKFIVEGFHLVEEAYKANRLLEVIILDGSIIEMDVKINYVTEKVLKSISMLDTPPQIMGVVSTYENKDLGNRIVILDDVQDPGNIGTIIRNSVAFNIDTVVLSKNSVSPYNDKLVRATQGNLFHINVVKGDLRDIIPNIKSKGIKVYSTCLESSKEMKEINFDKKFAIVFGNEGNGISEEVKKMSDELVRIKMNNKCESLNVGVSSGIILYNLMREE